MRYGLPYQGSKNKIALEIVRYLPKGKRLVDLFGGGGAITHAAAFSGKWDSILYNEPCHIVRDTFQRATNGDFKDFEPKWVSRAEFNEKKALDGYIALCWSFGNNMDGYIFGFDLEPKKKAVFEYVVNGIEPDIFKSYPTLKSSGWKERMREWRRKTKDMLRAYQELQSLDSLQSLESLQRLQSLESLEITEMDYRDYAYRGGDVVYCDPPYPNTEGYRGEEFDFDSFLDWVDTRDYQVFFSTYEIKDPRFFLVWEQRRVSTFSKDNNSLRKVECIYSNKPYRESLLGIEQDLFERVGVC